MSNLVGKLRARLGLDAGQFNRGLDKAQSRTRRFASAVGKNVALAAAAMTAAAVAGIAAMTRQSMTFVDEQAKVARTIDGSIDGLRALQIAAGDAGVASADLNKSMQMIGARLVEAKVKGGASAKALDRLGVSADALLKVDADKRLAMMADRVKELGWSSGQTTQFLMDMGVRSKEMALLMMQGGDAIRSARQEVEDMGLSLSAVDAAKVEAANDAMSRIKLSTEAVGNRLAVAFAPALQKIAQMFTEGMRAGGGFREIIDFIGARVSALIGLLIDVATLVRGAIAAFKGLISEGGKMSLVADAIGLAVLPIYRVIAGVVEAIRIMAHLVRTTGGFGGAMSALAPLADEVWKRIGDGVDYVRAAVSVVKNKMVALFYAGLRKMAGAWVKFTQDIANGLNALFGTSLVGASAVITQELGAAELAADDLAAAAAKAMEAASSSFGAPLKSLEALRASVNATTKDAEDGLNGAAEAAENLGSALDDTSGGGGGASGKLDKVKSSADKLIERLKPLKEGLRSTFSDALFGAKSLSQALSELLKKFAQMMFDRAFNTLFDSAVGGFSGGSKSKGGFGKFISGLLSFDGGGSTGMGARMGGLDGKGGFLAMMHPNETVIDHTRGQSAGGGLVDVRLYVDQDGNWKAKVEQISGNVSAKITEAKMRQASRQQADSKYLSGGR